LKQKPVDPEGARLLVCAPMNLLANVPQVVSAVVVD